MFRLFSHFRPQSRNFVFFRPPRRSRRRAEWSQVSAINETTPLHDACRNGDANTITKLVYDGANIHAKDEYGETPLHLVCGTVIHRISVEDVKCLVDHGADPNTKNSFGIAPLHYASQCAHVNVVQYFLRHGGGNVNLCDNQGKTPLHRACIGEGNAYVIQCLLEHGARNVKDYKGWTPLHYACWYGRVDHVEVLLSNSGGMDVYERGSRVPYPINDVQLSTYPFVGMDFCPTPLDLARIREHTKVVALFEKYEEVKRLKRRMSMY